MHEVTINGKNYRIPEVDFDAVCDLEERGVDLLSADAKHPKLAITLRGIVAWIMGVNERAASAEIMAHINNGGSIIEIMNGVTAAMQDSGFFGRSESANVTQIPQDHQKKRKGRRNESERTTGDSQT